MIRDTANAIYHGSGACLATEDIINNMPARIKTIPPTISYFQDIHRIIARTNTGILCIKSPNIVPQKPRFSSKTSSENIVRKRRNSIHRIRGVQYINLLIFFDIIGYVRRYNCGDYRGDYRGDNCGYQINKRSSPLLSHQLSPL